MRWQAVALCLLVVAPGAVAWSQHGGDERTRGVADVAQPLDIVANLRLAPPGTSLLHRSLVLETPDGLLAAVSIGTGSERECQIARTPHGALPVLLDASFPCPAHPSEESDGPPAIGRQGLMAFDSSTGLALFCQENQVGDVLLAFDATTGALEWGIGVPVADFDVPATGPGACSTLAVKDGIAYVPFWSGAVTRVAAIDLRDGRVLWQREPATEPGFAVPQVPQGNGSFYPAAVSLTDTGIVVLGNLGGSHTSGPIAPGYRAFTLDGAATSGRNGPTYGPTLTPVGGDTYLFPYLSRWAAVRGALAAFAIGQHVYLVDPSHTDLNAMPLPLDIPPSLPVGGPVAWSNDDLVLSLDYFVAAFHGSDRTGHGFTYGGYRVADLLLDGNGNAIVLNAAPRGGRLEPVLVVHHLASQTDRQRLMPDLGLIAPYNFVHPRIQMQGTAQGLLVWNDEGDATLLGRSPHPGPDVHVSDLYPPVGDLVRITPPPGASYLVSWGDRFEEPGAGPFERRLQEEGDTHVLVTELRPDGTTATTEVVLHVGKTPPRDLNFLQKAFSDRNQDWTFFILGLAITLGGALLAIVARRRSQSRIHAELAELDQIAEQGRLDRIEARRDLDDFERSLRLRLANGQLRDTQYDILDRRARDVRKDLS